MNYSYGNSDWKDLLTEYNGTAISYDLSGNPLNWRNASSLTWDGRRLSGMTLTDGTELAFEYNSEGLRTGKTVGNSTVQYIWNEGNLIAEIRDGYTLKFLYNDGEAAGFSYNGADYYYGKDSFGVIRYLYNTSGEVVTTYTYDAWGNVLSVTGTLAETVGTVNPVRYKSYYLDSETGWYYLRSRYYDPFIDRFLSCDILVDLKSNVGINRYAYCNNSPVSKLDLLGYYTITKKDFVNDHFGITLVVYYMMGRGKKRSFSSKQWRTYMMNARMCGCDDCRYDRTQTLGSYITQSVRRYLKNPLLTKKNGKMYRLNMGASISNGEGIVGYNYLHGVNMIVGGLELIIYCISSKKVMVTCKWHDIIDPNFKYDSDRVKANLANIIGIFVLSKPANYEIVISWTQVVNI